MERTRKVGVGVFARVKHDRRYRGTIDDINLHPDDTVVFRVNNRWWRLDQLEAA